MRSASGMSSACTCGVHLRRAPLAGRPADATLELAIEIGCSIVPDETGDFLDAQAGGRQQVLRSFNTTIVNVLRNASAGDTFDPS